jgi:4'-phosphopantetheinyl transferase EntD
MSVYDIDFEREIRDLSQLGGIKAAELTIGVVRDYRSVLFSNEATYVKGVVERRAREFSTGRRVAREALARVGIENCEIPSEDRRPVWPASVTGSITHTRSLAAAIAGPRSRFVGLGIDLEEENAVSQKISGRVLTETEREWLPGPGWRSMIFASKEAVYKAINPVIGEFLGFQDVELEVDVEDGKFRAHCLQERDSSEYVAEGHGYWGLYRDHWLVVFVI